MRILHAIHSANPRGGGPIEGLKQLSMANIAQGHSVEVVTIDSPGQEWMKDFPLPLFPMGPAIFRYGYSSRLLPWLRENHRKYDVVIVNGIWQYNSFGVWRALHRSQTPYCVFTHGMLDPWFKHAYPLKHLKKWLYWPWGEYRVLRDALAVFFTCEEERRLARRSFWLYHCDEIVLTYGTGAAPGLSQEEEMKFQQKFPELAGKRLILFLGRIHEKKGCDLLIAAFARFLREGAPSGTDDLHLVMAGPEDNEYGKRLRKKASELEIAERITWTGMLSGGPKWGAFRAAEVFILPSHQENFGIAVAEALSCGLAVLISNKVNIWREIYQDGAGFVENDDAEGTFGLLKRWFGLSRAEQDAMRAKAVECYDSRFSIPRVANSFTSALKLLGL
jgi:glycosyltransferase involved in cell wall biosynthesis